MVGSISFCALHGVAANFLGIPCQICAIRGSLYSEGIYRSKKMRSEDGNIIHECLNGETEAFGILVDKYKEGIYAFVYGKLRHFQDAQDVTQEVFLQAYRDLRSLRRWESFVFWLYRIASTRCKLWIRGQSRRVDQDFIQDQAPRTIDIPSLDSYRKDQLSESLREALDLLPEIYREVLMLHYFGGMSIKDIARAVGASPSAIGKRLSRARSQLKEEMVTMTGTAFEGQGLTAGFTFRIVEAVKRIKINTMPRVAGLPWGLSLAAGIIFIVICLSPHLRMSDSMSFPASAPLPSQMKVLKAGEIPVDILDVSQMLVIASKQADDDDGGELPDPQNLALMVAHGQGNTWAAKADMPTARYGLSASAVDGKIYVIAGCEKQGWPNGFPPIVEEYDPATDTWSEKSPIPTARARLSTCVLDGKIYAIGGWPRHGSVELYDPETDTWERKAPILVMAERLTTAAVDGKIYAFGGWAGGTVATAQEYDPITDKWTKIADLPFPGEHFSANTVNGKIYIIGWYDNVLEYDPIGDEYSWKAAVPLKEGEGWHMLSASVVNGKIYAMGGDGAHGNHVAVYDPATDTWEERADMPTARAFLATSAVGGKIYAIGGTPPGPNVVMGGGVELSTVEVYDTGFIPKSVEAKGKLPTRWGEVKSE